MKGTRTSAAMYVALVAPEFNEVPKAHYTWRLSVGVFLEELAKNGVAALWFAYMAFRYLTHDDVDMRLDRVEQAIE